MRKKLCYSFEVRDVIDDIIDQISNFAAQFQGPAVIGISGGKDSAVAAALCVEALGENRVLGVIMPNGEMKDKELAISVAKSLGIEYNIVDIHSPLVEISKAVNANSYAEMNLAPRLRMATLYAQAQTRGGWVVNTSNVDEIYLGYFTLWGDGVGDLCVLSDLHASEVVEIGEYYCDVGMLPEEVVFKAPADGLSDMTDEKKWGFTYKDVANIIDKEYNKVDPSRLAKILEMHERSKFKCYDKACVRLHFIEDRMVGI